VQHLEENVAAAGLALEGDQFEELDRAGREEWSARKR
jgi:aryl-alcohol dehydrogenase-like predicted oxidoreductase